MKGRIVGLLSAIILLSQVTMAWSEEQVDPYLWLEEVRGEKALEWVKARNDATLAVLKAQPRFQETYDKALEILNSNVRIPYPQIRGEYLYNFWQDEKNERGLWRRTTLKQYRQPSPKWEVLLDIDQLCRDEGEQWVFKGAAGLYPDYNLFLVRALAGRRRCRRGAGVRCGREAVRQGRLLPARGQERRLLAGPGFALRGHGLRAGEPDGFRLSPRCEALEARDAAEQRRDRVRGRGEGRRDRVRDDQHAGATV